MEAELLNQPSSVLFVHWVEEGGREETARCLLACILENVSLLIVRNVNIVSVSFTVYIVHIVDKWILIL